MKAARSWAVIKRSYFLVWLRAGHVKNDEVKLGCFLLQDGDFFGCEGLSV
jgi:hypothetical protein